MLIVYTEKGVKTMRDIVFRGKTIEGGAWICGDLRQYSENVMGIKPRNMPHTTKVIPETVGQYSGIEDKNGLRIFEGDIVRARIEGKCIQGFVWLPQKVVFKRGAFGVMDRWDRFNSFTGHTDIVTFEVIGNIYDTPDAMEENENE